MKKLRRAVVTFWVIILSLPMLAFANPAQLTQLVISSNTQLGSRATFSFSQPTEGRVIILSHPDRLALDFSHAQLATNLKNIKWDHSLFKQVRSGHPTPGILRLVFDLKTPVIFHLSPPSKLITLDIDRVKTNNLPLEPHLKRVSQQAALLRKVIKQPVTHPITVVIDPGHGGQDPGAVGEYGTQEKNIVLLIGKRLAELINRQPNMRAVLTRDTDVFIPLVERLKLARKGKADLFIAIHADSYFDRQSSGASVYALSRSGATSVAARWLSNRDNHSELGGLNLRELEDQSLQLRSVLIDLAQTATIVDSLRLGTSMLGTLKEVTKLHYSRIEQAPFLVLKSPDIPSILVETGFLSNPKEEKKLRDAAYQEKIANAIFNGIRQYLKKYSSSIL